MKVAIIGSWNNGKWYCTSCFVTAGCEVKVFDTNQEALNKSKNQSRKCFVKVSRKRKKITNNEKLRIIGKYFICQFLNELSHSDLVIEAIIEKI